MTQQRADALGGLQAAFQFCLTREGETREFLEILDDDKFYAYKREFEEFKRQATRRVHKERLNLAKTDYPTPSDWLNARAEPTFSINNNKEQFDSRLSVSTTLVTIPDAARITIICREIIEAIRLETTCEETSHSPVSPNQPDESAWVPATSLWKGRFKSSRDLEKFRENHQAMFRNPSRYRLEIHARRWTAYWAKIDRQGFDSLSDSMPSIADDPKASEEFIAGAAGRLAEIKKKKQGKQ